MVNSGELWWILVNCGWLLQNSCLHFTIKCSDMYWLSSYHFKFKTFLDLWAIKCSSSGNISCLRVWKGFEKKMTSFVGCSLLLFCYNTVCVLLLYVYIRGSLSKQTPLIYEINLEVIQTWWTLLKGLLSQLQQTFALWNDFRKTIEA